MNKKGQNYLMYLLNCCYTICYHRVNWATERTERYILQLVKYINILTVSAENGTEYELWFVIYAIYLTLEMHFDLMSNVTQVLRFVSRYIYHIQCFKIVFLKVTQLFHGSWNKLTLSVTSSPLLLEGRWKLNVLNVSHIPVVQRYIWVSESKLTVRYVYWHVLSRSTYCSRDVIDGLSEKIPICICWL